MGEAFSFRSLKERAEKWHYSCAQIHDELGVFMGFVVSQNIWIKITKHLPDSKWHSSNKWKMINHRDEHGFLRNLIWSGGSFYFSRTAAPMRGVSVRPGGPGGADEGEIPQPLNSTLTAWSPFPPTQNHIKFHSMAASDFFTYWGSAT